MKLYQNIADNLAQFSQMMTYLESKQTPQLVVGLSEIHKAHFLYAAAKKLPGQVLVVTDEEAQARRICDDINAMEATGQEIAYLYPVRDFTFRQVDTASKEFEQIRLGVLSRVLSGECRICVCSVEALMQRTIPPEELKARSFTIDTEHSYDLQDLSARLVRAGYVRRPQVEGIAQFAVRGGILDIYPPNENMPVRIEFWGDEIDSISSFELETQRRTEPLKELVVIPASECLFDSEDDLKSKILELQKRPKNKKAAFLQHDLERLERDGELMALDKYLPLAYQQNACLLDYLPDSAVFLSEYGAVREHAKNYEWQMEEDIKILFEEGELCHGLDCYSQPFSVFSETVREEHALTILDTFARSNPDINFRGMVTINPVQTSNFSGELKVLYEDVYPLLESGYCVAILAGTEKAGQNLAHDLQKMGLPAEYSRDMRAISYRRITVLSGNISAGFEYPEIKFALISTNRSMAVKQKRQKVYKKGKTIRNLDDLSQGDLVVHVSHGIGVFDGIHKMDLHGVVKDYIKIKYAGADTLYVPVTQLDLVSKYIGPKDDGRVKLNRLNSGEWQKTKTRVRKACADMADELIALYAKRMQAKGNAFPEDNDWQREFEEHFEYEETDDQLRCIEEVKGDMQKAYPMDRLLCGDVGFGKTEVAFRAAMKCVLAGKQCAILCPTTILAWQHYQNCLKRFEQYPVRIELMSRFRTPKQVRETVKRLKTGEVDIIIGTHRIVQKDIEFKELGLAVIDEEQRFGVAHKERFKEMFAAVDMLTLSATPIPRTLNMAMNGIRDISTIEQPPQDRHPVQTYVLEHDMGMLGTAMRKELRRGGQIYYIHNRVETIDLCAGRIKQEVPDANIGIAHGKMTESELSEIWRQLIEHEIDILVCTTIIETGVDVKNCNTLIIEDADRLGLAQLYQLRGRVGRSNRRAFAYFTFHRGKVLSEIATKRLNAIREFTTFGSGFRIAMRDMEIRGAGSILGGRQHGHMEAVGYDMYVRLLKEAVEQKRGEANEEKSYECLIDVQLDAHIPESYIENLSQRLDVYKKIASVRNEEDKMDLIDELIDRFGDVPASVETLLEVGLLRNTLADHGFSEINQKAYALMLYPEKLNMQTAQKIMDGMKGRASLNASSKPYFTVRLRQGENVVRALQDVVASLVS